MAQENSNLAKPKFCKLSKIAGILMCISFTAVLLMNLIFRVIDDEMFLVSLFVFTGIAGLGVFVAFLSAIVSIIRTSYIARPQRGKILSFAIICLILVPLFQIGFSAYATITPYTSRVLGILEVGHVLLDTGIIETGEVDSWCDVVLESQEGYPRYESISNGLCDMQSGNSPYFLNKEVIGFSRESLPHKTVVLFEGGYVGTRASQWNSIGGIDSVVLSCQHNRRGCILFFADGKAKHVPVKDLDDYHWEVGKENQIPEHVKEAMLRYSHYSVLAKVLCGTITVTLMAVAFILRLRFVVLSIIVVLTNVVFSACFGWVSTIVCHDYLDGKMAILMVVLIGCAIAFVYMGIMSRYILRAREKTRFAISVGMATGAVCSIMTHLCLSCADGGENWFSIMAGIPYGVIAGAVLGLITGTAIKKFYVKNNGKS